MSGVSASAGPEADIFHAAWDGLNRALNHPHLRETAALVEKGRFGQAVQMLRTFLRRHPRDAGALRLMAQIAMCQKRKDEARSLLQKCLELKPAFAAARLDYARLLLEENELENALAEAETLLGQSPRNLLFRRLRADALEANGNYAASMELWRELTSEHQDRPECWVPYGNVLRALGSSDDCIAAFRKAIELNPAFTAGWVGLADLKTFRFSIGDIDQMERQLARADLSVADRTNLHFALGKAWADLNDFEKSFSHFARGNAVRRLAVTHDPDVLAAYVSACKRVFTADFFQKYAGSGSSKAGPIFLVGMPRTGSTLVEQILASHSQIEGTRELVELAALSRDIQQIAAELGSDYPGVFATLDPAVLGRLGEQYLAGAQVHRKLRRRFFIDKMGANFVHVGLIQLVLPNAKIVDVRRHPVACCFSNFSQLFPTGQNNAYRLSDLGRLYRDYVELMAHFDSVLNGKVHRILYENLVEEPEPEIRRLLSYLGLDFEEACLNFFSTDRVVTTVSSEQVRRPIYRDALEHWRRYEPWLGALKTTLGPVLDAYPGVPAFD